MLLRSDGNGGAAAIPSMRVLLSSDCAADCASTEVIGWQQSQVKSLADPVITAATYWFFKIP